MRPSRLLPALAALLIATAPVMAEDTSQGLLLPFGGAPSWVLKPPGGPAPTIDMNFATGQYYGLQPSQLSVTRASPDNEVCNGTLYQFGNNVAPITPCGLWAWEARTNSVPNNTNQGAGAGAYPTGWSVFNPSGATVSFLGVTVNNGVSYLGVQLSGTTNSTSQIQIFQTSSTGIAATAGQVWTQSIYAYYSGSLTGITSVGAQANWNTSGGAYANGPIGVSFTPTTSPARYQGSSLITGATVAFLQPLIAFNVTTGQTLNGTFYFALSQMELNPNLLASVASATVAGGGAAYVGASGTMTWSGAGCTTNPVLNATTSAGAINAVTSVATAGSCATFPAAGATTWTPGGGLSIGTGATFNLVPTDNSAQAFATGPILTSGAAVTRAAGPVVASVSAGLKYTLACQFTKYSPNLSASYSTCGELDDGTNNNRLYMLATSTNSTFQYGSAIANSYYVGNGNAISQNTLAKMAISTSGLSSMGGATSATFSPPSVPSVSKLHVGVDASVAFANGVVSRISLFANNSLSQSALNYVTSH